MARIAEIEVGVTANTKQYKRDLKSANSATDKFRSNLTKAAIANEKLDKRLRLAAAGAKLFAKGVGLAGVAVGGLIVKFRSLAEAQREIQLRAGQFGISPRELKAVTQTFKNLGVEADAVIDAVQTINERVEEARKGEGTAVEVFQALNINVEKFAKLNVAEKFERLSVAFAATSDSAKRTLASTDLFGDEASKIVGAFRQISEFSSELRSNMKDVKFDENVTAAAKRMDTSLNRLGQETNKFLSGLAPIVDMLAKWIERLNDAIRSGILAGPFARGEDRVLGRKGLRGGQALTDAQKRAAGGVVFGDAFTSGRFRVNAPKTAGPQRAPIDGTPRTRPAVPENFKINATLEDLFPDLKTDKKFQESKRKQEAFDAKIAINRIGNLGKTIASSLGPALKTAFTTLGDLNIPLGPQQVTQEANAALIKGSAEAFSAINRASNPQMKLDEQRNIKLDKLVANGVQILQRIGGAGQTIIDTVTF